MDCGLREFWIVLFNSCYSTLDTMLIADNYKMDEKNTKLFLEKDDDVDICSAECCRINQVILSFLRIWYIRILLMLKEHVIWMLLTCLDNGIDNVLHSLEITGVEREDMDDFSVWFQ